MTAAAEDPQQEPPKKRHGGTDGLAANPGMRKACSEAGRRGGRPPTKFRYRDKMRQIEQKARDAGHLTLVPLAVRYWKGVLEGRIRVSDAVRAHVADTVADRFNLPKKTELTAEIDLTVKTFELGGYRDLKGNFVRVEEAQVIEDPALEAPPPESDNGHHAENGSAPDED